MTKEKRSEGINLSFEGMLWAQFLMDAAQSKRDQRIAQAMYESFWCLWTVLTDDQRQGRIAATLDATVHNDREEENVAVITVCDVCGETILQPDRAKVLTIRPVKSVWLADENAKSYDICESCLRKIKAALSKAAEGKK